MICFWFSISPKLVSIELGGTVTKSFEALVSDSHRIQFIGITMGQWRLFVEYWQTHRVTTLGTDRHITLTENMNGLNSPFIGVTSFIPLPPISETEGDAYLTIKSLISTMNDPLKLEDPVTKLTLKISHQFLIKLNTLPTPLTRTTLIDCHNVFSGELNFCKRVKNIISIQ